MGTRFSFLGTMATVLALGLGTFASGCGGDGPTNPGQTNKPTVTDDELAEMAATMLGEATGGFRMQAMDLVDAAQGETIRSATKKQADPEILRSKSVQRTADATINGGRYAYNYAISYSYKFTTDGFLRGDGEKLDSLVNGVNFQYTIKGTHDAPRSQSNDSGLTNTWDVRRLAPDTSLLSIAKGSFDRTGTQTMKSGNKTISRKLSLKFRYVRINPQTKTIKSDETADPTFFTEFFATDLRVGSDTTLVRDEEGNIKIHTGTVFFREDGTATLKLNGKTYVIDVMKGEVKK